MSEGAGAGGAGNSSADKGTDPAARAEAALAPPPATTLRTASPDDSEPAIGLEAGTTETPVVDAPVAEASNTKAPTTESNAEPHACLNCGATLSGAYCARCGQKAHLHRTLSAFGHDLLHGVFHLEGKIWGTLPLLAWHPGELTRRYIHGERAKFISPIAIFLFAVFLLFAAAGLTVSSPEFGDRGTRPVAVIEQQLVITRAEIARRRAALDNPALNPSERAAAGEALASAREDLANLLTARNAVGGVTDDSLVRINGRDVTAGNDQSTLAVMLRTLQQEITHNPDLLFYKIKSSAYKFAWALIPLSLPFVWLAMLGPGMKDRRLYDFTVFTTYSLAFMLLFSVVLMLVSAIGVPSAIIALAFLLYAPFHLYRHTRETWQLHPLSATARTAVLLVSVVIVLPIFTLLLLAMDLMR